MVDVAFLSSPVEIRRVQGTSGKDIRQINSVTREMQKRKLVQEDHAEASVRNRAPKKESTGSLKYNGVATPVASWFYPL